MTDHDNFKKVLFALIHAPKPYRLSLDTFGEWYDDGNTTEADYLENFDWAVKSLVVNGDYGLAVWSCRPEVRRAFVTHWRELAIARINEWVYEDKVKEVKRTTASIPEREMNRNPPTTHYYPVGRSPIDAFLRRRGGENGSA